MTGHLPPRESYPAGAKGSLVYCVSVFTHPPRFFMRLQPFFALITGIAYILFLRKGFGYIPVILVFITAAFIFIVFRL